MEQVRIGIIGCGNMGSGHAAYLTAGKIPTAKLTAVCDISPARLQWAKENANPDGDLHTFASAEELLSARVCDAVIIATPHYFHPVYARQALAQGYHVLSEKPAGVYTKAVRELNEQAVQTDRVFGIMFNQRTNPMYQKVREMVQSGMLGEMKRVVWIITNWYRPQSYYNSGGWRATWAGEGGGVLLNQDPHQLDLWQWICGMPVRVRAFCAFGKYHDIEVEDDVTAYVEYPNGATGLFVTTTGEAPGTNRLEISGNNGKIVVEDGKITFWKLKVGEREFNASWDKGFGAPEYIVEDVPFSGEETAHAGITANFVSAIINGTPLLSPGIEGIRGLTLSNAMHLSAWTDGWVDLPIDEDGFYAELQKRVATSKEKGETAAVTADLQGTFGKK